MALSQGGPATVELDDKQMPVPKRIGKSVFVTLRSCGYDVMTVGDLEAPSHSDVSGGLTPGFANEVRKLDNAGVFSHMDLTDDLDGVFGEPSGSSHVTVVFVRAGKTVAKTVAKLYKRGHIDAAINKAILEEKPEGIDLTSKQEEKVRERVTDMVAYKIAEFAKGWVAEKTLTETDALAKASMSNDIGEQDAYDRNLGEYVQIKSVTLGYRPNPTVESTDKSGHYKTTKNEVPVIFYQWTCDGELVYGRDYKAVNGEAAKRTDKSKTLLGKAAGNMKACKEYGRSFRYIWW